MMMADSAARRGQAIPDEFVAAILTPHCDSNGLSRHDITHGQGRHYAATTHQRQLTMASALLCLLHI